MPIFQIKSFKAGTSDYEDKGPEGSFKHATNLDIRKKVDSLSAGQALMDIGLTADHHSPSRSTSPSSSVSPSLSGSVTPSPSSSQSPSLSTSGSQSASSGISPSPSLSPSVSVSRSPSVTPSSSISLSPSPSGGLSTLFADLIRTFVEASDGFVYGFGSTGHIYRIDEDLIPVWVYTDPDGAIKGACESPADNAKTYLSWSTDKAVKKKEIPGNNNWNDVTTVGSLESADWHTQREIDGSTLIANSSKLAMIGYDQSFTPEALNLIPGNAAKTLVERNGRVVIGTYRKAYPTAGINAAIDSEYPLAQIGEDGEIFFANMVDTMPAKRFPGGGIVNPGGVTNEARQAYFFDWQADALSWIDKQAVGNLSLWAVYGVDTNYGGVYSYGRRNKSQPFALNLEHLLDADELGAVIHAFGVTIVSYRSGSVFGVKVTDLSAKAEATYEGLDLKSPVKKPIKVTNWYQAELIMAPLPANSWIEFWYRVDKTGDFIRARTTDKAWRHTTANSKLATFSIGVNGKIFEPRVVIHPYGNQTPEIYEIRVHFN